MPRVKLNGPAVFGWSGLFYVWTASDAATFRFACGSVRRSPKHSTQSWPGATPQVGQGTASIKFGTNRVSFIQIGLGQDILDRLFNFGQSRAALTFTN